MYRKLAKAQEQVKIATTASVDLEDKDGLRKAVLEHLFTESERGNAQASDKLAKLAGLGEGRQAAAAQEKSEPGTTPNTRAPDFVGSAWRDYASNATRCPTALRGPASA